MERLGSHADGVRLAGQMAGSKFEEICKEYLKAAFPRLASLRPGQWEISKGVGGRSSIAQYDQYEHLAALDAISAANPELAAALGSDYLIKPDVVVIRLPEEDSAINADGLLVDKAQANLTPLRRVNSERPILHASVSCKWTLRSDRAAKCAFRRIEPREKPQGTPSSHRRRDRRTYPEPHRLNRTGNRRY